MSHQAVRQSRGAKAVRHEVSQSFIPWTTTAALCVRGSRQWLPGAGVSSGVWESNLLTTVRTMLHETHCCEGRGVVVVFIGSCTFVAAPPRLRLVWALATQELRRKTLVFIGGVHFSGTSQRSCWHTTSLASVSCAGALLMLSESAWLGVALSVASELVVLRSLLSRVVLRCCALPCVVVHVRVLALD